MSKRVRLSRSGIEYLDYSWGIFSGCRNLQAGVCDVINCWAKGIALHYPKLYPEGFEPCFYLEALESPRYLRRPGIIGVGWVGDVIGYGHDFKDQIFDIIEQCPRHTFVFLTKNYDRLPFWSPFPPNCWVGATACRPEQMAEAVTRLSLVKAGGKFLSLEPLRSWDNRFDEYLSSWLLDAGIGWVIIGAQSRPMVQPQVEWLRDIVEAADEIGACVFLKNNLKPLLCEHWNDKSLVLDWTHGESEFEGVVDVKLRQETPLPQSTKLER